MRCRCCTASACTSLVISYRNDRELPRPAPVATTWASPSGATSRRRVLHAVQAGARDVVLFGWSMGGAIALQLIDRSWTADRVCGRGAGRAGDRLA